MRQGLILKSDREKWDLRYSREARGIPEPDEFLVSNSSFLTSGIALDLACGLGGNSVFLANRGYSVHALDVSSEAIFGLHEKARIEGLSIYPLVADVDCFQLPKSFYDLIIVFYFFAKDLMPDIMAAVKKGGLLFYATYNQRHRSVNPTFNPDYLVSADGFVQYFSAFDILVSETAAGENQNVSRILARKPAD